MRLLFSAPQAYMYRTAGTQASATAGQLEVLHSAGQARNSCLWFH